MVKLLKECRECDWKMFHIMLIIIDFNDLIFEILLNQL